ncbi:sensor histidine kinase [Brachybacterium hainanense]|uniref:histidine kinase n=1 Tax=Brachybacterium hainanense TaxID=1541174 RepID=A0ABV6R808_9MICO
MAPASTSSTSSRSPRTVPRRFLAALAGPRFIDPPLRLILAILAAIQLLGLDTTAPGGYVLLQALMTASVLVTAWAPGAAAVIMVMGFLVNALAFPERLNLFLDMLALPLGVLLSQRRLRGALLTFSAFCGAAALAVGLDTYDGRFIGPGSFVVPVLASILGWSAHLLEARTEREIARREEAAREHELELARIRIDVAIDTHDTVSHGLATESAIIRVLGAEARRGGQLDLRTLSELGMVNDRAHQQLRRLLARLRGEIADEDGETDLDAALDSAVQSVRAGAAAGDIGLEVELEPTGAIVPVLFAEAATSMLYELATNIFKHADPHERSRIDVRIASGSGSPILELGAGNHALRPEPFTPRTLSRRAKRFGGECDTRVEAGGDVHVRVWIPVPATPTGQRTPDEQPQNLPRADEASARMVSSHEMTQM